LTNAFSVVTSCTQRKSGPVLMASDRLLDGGSVADLGRQWRALISADCIRYPVHALYKGRSVLDAASVASHLCGKWYVVSAGVGLVSSERSVPAYECTVAEGSPLASQLTRLKATARDWWNEITVDESRPLARLIAANPTLLALPSSYLEMVYDDLDSISVESAEGLRIFTSKVGVQKLPSHIVQCAMPYDDRLESLAGYAGTRSDFAQRAMLHFVRSLGGEKLSMNEARESVSSALDCLPWPVRSRGVRKTDDEIKAVLKEQWANYSGRSTLLLRYLRDDAKISCEQRRFSRIWQSLVKELHE